MSGKNSTLRGENFKPFFRPGFIIAGFFIFLFLVLAPFSLNLKSISLTRAETQVNSQYINSNTTWTLVGSPYVINADYLFVNAVLTIEPGVIIKFSKNNIIVNASGQLIAQGEESLPIIFTSINDDSAGGKTVYWSTGVPLPGDWGSIQVRGGRAVLDHAKISYGGEVCVSEIGSKPVKLQVAYAGWCYDAAVFSGQGDIAINNSEIFSNKSGLEFYDESPVISNSKIYNNQGGGLFYYGDGQLNAINNWWGDDSGPHHETLNPQGQGDSITGNVLFDPWTGKQVAPKRNPVIIVPGILGSYFKDRLLSDELWPNFTLMSLPGPDSYLNALELNQFGEQDNNNPMVTSTDIFRKIADLDFFSGLIRELENNGYEENKDLFVFPYDWRMNLNLTAGDSQSIWQETLKQKIIDVKKQTGADKVDAIAHSMGGLLVKDYIDKYGNDSIDKFIDIATPHLGAPSAFKVLNYGDNLDICLGAFGLNYCILNEGKIKDISQNMPSAYQLLPSRKYFESGIPGISFTNSYILDGSQNAWIPSALNYDQSIAFLATKKDKDLIGATRNQFLLGYIGINAINVNDELHSRIDNLPNSDNYYNIIGCGQPTYAGVIIKGNKNEELAPLNGDGTVPLRSAMPFGSHQYYSTSTTHAYIPSVNGVRQLIVSILQGNESNFDFSAFQGLSRDQSICGSINGVMVGSQSPVELNIYDENGNHTGPTANGDIEENIPDVTYDILGSDKYAFLPAGHIYHIVNQATSSGELGITIQKIENSQQTQFIYFNGIKLNSASTVVGYNIVDNQMQFSANVDSDGNGTIDKIINPDSILTGEQMNDLTAPQTTVNISGKMGNNGYYVSSTKVSFMATEDNSGVLKTRYSLDNGNNWIGYNGTFTVSQDGTTTILYYSIDKAGNQEENNTVTIKIDQTKPIISVLLPQENQEILHSAKLNVTYFAIDNFSSIAAATAKIYLDGQAVSSNTIDLFKQNLSAHQIKITIQDLAGNQAEQIIDFLIIINVDGTIADVNRAYDEKMINKIDVRNNLVSSLTDIKTFQERYGQRIDKEKALRDKAMAQCLKQKNQAWCDQKIGNIFNVLEYQLSLINQAIIKLKYNFILAKLDLFLSVKWINQAGYNIIKGDIKYLMSKL